MTPKDQQQLQNPFVGLRPYDTSDSLYYFGRNAETKTLLRLLHQHRFVAVVGSSGSGKSSLIRAGLIPQLQAGFLVQDRDQWRVAIMKPGEDPLKHLIQSLFQIHSEDENASSAAISTTNILEAIQEQGIEALVEQLKTVFKNNDTNIFLLVDQFEELFRFNENENKLSKLGKQKKHKQRQQAEEFVSLLLSLSEHQLPIYVCLTMRSDFLGDSDAFYGLPEAINKSQFLVPRLTRNQRREVITNPIHLTGATIAPRLVDRLLNENIDTRDDLPVLQHAMMRTFDHWQNSEVDDVDHNEKHSNHPIDIQHYEKIDTIHKALDSHAEEVLDELNPTQLSIAKKLFQAVTAVDAGNRRIRRPAHINEVAQIANTTPEAVLEVVNHFRKQNRSFLMVSSENLQDNPLIDISHESLIRQWSQLKKWADEESELSKIYLRLKESAKLYKYGKANLYNDLELEQAIVWRNNIPRDEATVIWSRRYGSGFNDVSEFLELSEYAHQKEISAKKAEVEQETRNRMLVRVIVLLTLVTSIVTGLYYFAVTRPLKEEQRAKMTLKKLGVEFIRGLEGKTIIKFPRSLSDTQISQALPSINTVSDGRTSFSLSMYFPKISRGIAESLHQVKNLHKLTISDKSFTRLDAISNITGLQYLDISKTSVSDISSIQKFKSLLVFKGSRTAIKDIEYISKMKNLKWLDVSNTGVHDVSPLKKATQLEILNLSLTNISDITPISLLNNLRNLDISSTDVSNIDAIKHLPKLDNLNISRTDILGAELVGIKAGVQTIGLDLISGNNLESIIPGKDINIISGASISQPGTVLKIGESFRDCPKCPQMIVLPKGRFKMGSSRKEIDRSKNEGPKHLVILEYHLAVGKYPVRFDEYDLCVNTGSCEYISDGGFGRGTNPVINITWNQAKKYTDWLSKISLKFKKGFTYRLLTEAEWEFAARAGSDKPNYWEVGKKACQYANVADISVKKNEEAANNWRIHACDDNYTYTSPVGSFLPNKFGLYDMIGNVWQWVGEDCWRPHYYQAPTNGGAWLSTKVDGCSEGSYVYCGNRIARGGSWGSAPSSSRFSSRFNLNPNSRNFNLGFRITRKLHDDSVLNLKK